MDFRADGTSSCDNPIPAAHVASTGRPHYGFLHGTGRHCCTTEQWASSSLWLRAALPPPRQARGPRAARGAALAASTVCCRCPTFPYHKLLLESEWLWRFSFRAGPGVCWLTHVGLPTALNAFSDTATADKAEVRP